MAVQPKPKWLRRRLSQAGKFQATRGTIDGLELHTVCQEADCPNRAECYGRGTATFLLLGPDCTRGCTFCAVGKTRPSPPDPAEPERVARAVERMGLDFCVLTMVTRDDLPDGGAGHVAATVEHLRRLRPEMGVEVLVSDLGGDQAALATVLAAKPQVFNHNVETVPRLYPGVRPQADFQRSLAVLRAARELDPQVVTKSGMMLGLGETSQEIAAVMDALVEAGCQVLTLGQYLAPSPQHHPVERYVPPEEFAALARQALERGFAAVASAPLVRSSYQAKAVYEQARENTGRG